MMRALLLALLLAPSLAWGQMMGWIGEVPATGGGVGGEPTVTVLADTVTAAPGPTFTAGTARLFLGWGGFPVTYNLQATIVSISDSRGDTWTKVVGVADGQNQSAEWWTTVPASAGSHTLTITLANVADSGHVTVVELPGTVVQSRSETDQPPASGWQLATTSATTSGSVLLGMSILNNGPATLPIAANAASWILAQPGTTYFAVTFYKSNGTGSVVTIGSEYTGGGTQVDFALVEVTP